MLVIVIFKMASWNSNLICVIRNAQTKLTRGTWNMPRDSVHSFSIPSLATSHALYIHSKDSILSIIWNNGYLLMVNETHRTKQFPPVLNGLTASRVHVLNSPLKSFGRVKRSLKNFSTWKWQAQGNNQLPQGSSTRSLQKDH